MIERERGRDTGGGRSRLHAESLMWDSIRGLQIAPWAKGRCQTAEPPRDPPIFHFLNLLLYIFIHMSFSLKTTDYRVKEKVICAFRGGKLRKGKRMGKVVGDRAVVVRFVCADSACCRLSILFADIKIPQSRGSRQ